MAWNRQGIPAPVIAKSTGSPISAITRYINRKKVSGLQQTFEQLSLDNSQTQTVGVQGFLARLFPLLANGQDLKICEELLSLKYSGLQNKESPRFYSLKMWQASSRMTKEGQWQRSSAAFGNLGMMSNGRCLILKTSESRRTGNGSSLSDILEQEVGQKYFLSEKATAKLLNSLSEEVKETECTTQGG